MNDRGKSTYSIYSVSDIQGEKTEYANTIQ